MHLYDPVSCQMGEDVKVVQAITGYRDSPKRFTF